MFNHLPLPVRVTVVFPLTYCKLKLSCVTTTGSEVPGQCDKNTNAFCKICQEQIVNWTVLCFNF